MTLFRSTSVASLMKLEPKVLYRPSQPNFPLIDFFAVIGNKLTFFQMTVSDSKPSPLDILSKAKLRPQIELYSKTFTADGRLIEVVRSEEHPSELQSLMRISYAVFC